MEKIRSQFGDRPTYITFDMDGIDANSCPGVGKGSTQLYALLRSFILLYTIGTMEVGGLTPIQAMEIVQGLKGMNIIGADLNEVSYTVEPLIKATPDVRTPLSIKAASLSPKCTLVIRTNQPLR